MCLFLNSCLWKFWKLRISSFLLPVCLSISWYFSSWWNSLLTGTNRCRWIERESSDAMEEVRVPITSWCSTKRLHAFVGAPAPLFASKGSSTVVTSISGSAFICCFLCFFASSISSTLFPIWWKLNVGDLQRFGEHGFEEHVKGLSFEESSFFTGWSSW